MRNIPILLLFFVFISCVKHPEVKLENQYCGPESVFFTATNDCPSAPRLDSNSIFILEGNGSHDTVMISVQGGPFVELRTDVLNFYEQHLDLAYAHQPQTLQGLKQEDFGIPNAWEMADVDILKSAAILDDAIKHFKNNGKTVFLVGGSWGAFVVQQWLADYENTADKIIIAVGRVHGVNIPTGNPSYSNEVNAHINIQINKDYRPMLEDRYLDNIFYLTGIWDQNVFPLTPEEIAWLDEKNIEHYELEGNHFLITEAKGTYLIMDILFRK